MCRPEPFDMPSIVAGLCVPRGASAALFHYLQQTRGTTAFWLATDD